MKLKWDKWLYGLGNAIIGGGAGAVISAFSNIAIAPGTFNLVTGEGATKVLTSMGVSFLISGALSLFFYLKQSPLPPEENSTDTPKTP
jgi:hypothetical protein